MNGADICIVTIRQEGAVPSDVTKWTFGDGLRFDFSDYATRSGLYELSPPFGELMGPKAKDYSEPPQTWREKLERIEEERREREERMKIGNERVGGWRDKQGELKWGSFIPLKEKIKEGRVCTKCGVHKPIEEFYSAKHLSTGIRANCKECKKKYQLNRNWKKNKAA